MITNELLVKLELLGGLATTEALKGNWEAAIKINREIVKSEGTNIDALNRLGHAYTEVGMIAEAMTAYRKVLKIDPYNGIAGRNLKRLKSIKPKGKVKKQLRIKRTNGTSPNLENLFLEVPGKTVTVHLVDLTEPKILARVNCADHLVLKTKRHQIAMTTDDGVYLGKLPDNLAARLIRLVTGGNRYEAFVKGISDDQLRVFLKETKRAKRFASVHSFPIDDKSLYVAFTPPDMIHGEIPESRTLEEQGDNDTGDEDEAGGGSEN